MAEINEETNKPNYMAADRGTSGDNGKKKKMIIGGVVGVVVLVVIIVIIVLATGKGGGGHHPHNNPNDPQNFQEMNYMKIGKDSVTSKPFSYSVTLDQDIPTPAPKTLLSTKADAKKVYKPVNPDLIPNNTANNEWVASVKLAVDLPSQNTYHMVIEDSAKSEYTTPPEFLKRPGMDSQTSLRDVFAPVEDTTKSPYSFDFKDRSTGKTLLSTHNRKFVMQSKFKEFGFEIASTEVYGLGLSNKQFNLQTGAYTMYSKTRVGGSVIDEYLGGQQGPAVHPFIMFKTEDNQFAGIYFPNSAPAQFEMVRYDGWEQSIINYITIGGAVEMYFILPDTADNVIMAYQNLIGKPAFPPLHALGFYQGSDSYSTLADFAAADKEYQKKHFIVEGYNLDNYNIKNQIFTIDDTTNFKGIDAWVDTLRSQGRSLILGLMEGVSTESATFTGMSKDDTLLMSSTRAEILQNFLHDTYVSYPDWYNKKTAAHYATGLEAINQKLTTMTPTNGGTNVHQTFEGISLSDNTNFGNCDYECYPKTAEELALIDLVTFSAQKRFLQADPKNEEEVGDYESYTILPEKDQAAPSIRNTPFQMGGNIGSGYGSFDVGIDATHPSKTEYKAELFYHNLNGYAAAQAISENLSNNDNLKAYQDKRPFVMSDNTFPGAGQYTGSWLSNFHRTWTDMRNSIAGVFSLNMFGVLTAGTEICGSLGEFDAELCGRWAQNAVLLPAVRNYYNSTFYNETSTKWETNPKGELFNIDSDTEYEYELAANGAIKQRYKFMQYIYTEMFKASQSGKPYVHPVFFEESHNSALFAEPLEDSYMAGDALHVSTVLESSKTAKEYRTKFPTGDWILLSDYMNVTMTVADNANSQAFKPMIGDSTVHLKAGKAIPYQKDVVGVMSTKQLLAEPTQFLVYRDAQMYAEGHIFLDDGQSALKDDKHSLWKFRHAAQTITFFLESGSSEYIPNENGHIESIKILKAKDLMDTDFACAISSNNEAFELLTIYNEGTEVLEIRASGNVFYTPKDIQKIVYGNSKKDINLCYQYKSFKYQVVPTKSAAPVTPTSSQMKTYHIQNIEVPSEQLYVTFMLIDDMGTVKITYSRDATPKDDPTAGMVDLSGFTYKDANIMDFIKVREDIFQFVVYDSNKNEIYSGDALMFFDPENKYIMTHSMIPLFKMDGLPIFGLAGRDGDAQWPKTKAATITLWNSESNTLDYQPFYMYKNVGGSWSGVFDLSTNAMDYTIETDRTNSNVIISHHTTSQNLHKYLMTASTPDKLVSLYQKLAGYPVVPPEWAFGWGHFKDGVASIAEWKQIQQDYQTGLFPLDHLWLSVDYTENFEALTVSTEKYPDLKKEMADLHIDNVHVIPVIESGISMNSDKSNTAHTSGVSAKVFVEATDGSNAVGAQHGNKVNYPDPTKAATESWWKAQITAFQKEYSFSGFWLTKNDLWNECNGFCSPYNVVGKQLPKENVEHNMGYIPGNENLNKNSLDISAKYSLGSEFDYHNRYPLDQAKITYNAFENDRPLILTSASVAGQGKYAASFTDNNYAVEAAMRQSIQNLYMSNIYGMPFSGSDICGFYNDPLTDGVDPELCARWYMIAAFQPFSRNGGARMTAAKAPYDFSGLIPGEKTATLENLIRVSMNVKYNLHRYMVSYFHGIAASGGTYYKPMWFNYPEDFNAYENTDSNIMLGESLKVSLNPTMQFGEGSESKYYFPPGRWCQIYPEDKTSSNCHDYHKEFNMDGYMTGPMDPTTKKYTPLENSFEQVFVHMSAGAIVPYQDAVGDVLNTSGLNDLATSYRFGTPTEAVTTGYVAFDEDSTGTSKAVRTYEITSQVVSQGKNVGIVVNFKKESGPEIPANYSPAKSMNENLGKLTFYDVAALQKQIGVELSYARVNYIKTDGTLGAVGTNSKYDPITESITFDFTEQVIALQKGINIAYVKSIQVLHAEI